jgi:hypothetical protein
VAKLKGENVCTQGQEVLNTTPRKDWGKCRGTGGFEGCPPKQCGKPKENHQNCGTQPQAYTSKTTPNQEKRDLKKVTGQTCDFVA